MRGSFPPGPPLSGFLPARPRWRQGGGPGSQVAPGWLVNMTLLPSWGPGVGTRESNKTPHAPGRGVHRLGPRKFLFTSWNRKMLPPPAPPPSTSEIPSSLVRGAFLGGRDSAKFVCFQEAFTSARLCGLGWGERLTAVAPVVVWNFLNERGFIPPAEDPSGSVFLFSPGHRRRAIPAALH